MADVSHFNIKIAVDAKSGQATVVGFGNAGKEAIEKIDKASKSAGGSFLSFSNMIKGAGVAAVAGLGMQMVKGAAELESYGTQFEVLLGSAEKGAKLFDDIRKAGASTPFETKDIAEATTRLLAMGSTEENVVKQSLRLGDIAMGNADKLQSLSLAFGKMQSSGKMTGEELQMMIDAGFNPLKIISEETGKSQQELRKEMEKGAISFGMVEKAINKATSEGGQFFGMSEKMSKTFQGMLSTLQDTIGTLLAEAGAPLLELLKELMPVVTPIIEKLGGALKPVIDALVKAVQTLLPPFMELLDKVFKAMQPIIDLAVNALGKLTPIFTKIITAAGKLVEAAMPMIEMFTSLAEEQLDELIPLLEAVLDMFIALSPAITLVATMTATLVRAGMTFLTTVVWPLRKAIEWILEFGAAAVNIVTGIFGGGGKKKPAAKPAAEGGGGGGGEGPQEGDLSPDGTMVWRGGKWVPIDTAKPTGDPKAAQKAQKEALAELKRTQEIEKSRLEISGATKEQLIELEVKHLQQVRDFIAQHNHLREGLKDAEHELSMARLEQLGITAEQTKEYEALITEGMWESVDETVESANALINEVVDSGKSMLDRMQESMDAARGLAIENMDDELEKVQARYDKEIEDLKFMLDQKYIAEEEYAERVKRLNKDTEDAKLAIQTETQAKVAAMLVSAIDSLSVAFNANFEEQKKFSLAAAIISTAQGIAASLAAGGPLGIAQAAVIALQGYAQIKKIIDTKPGGSSAPSKPMGQVEAGQAPTRGGIRPPRLSINGGSSMPTEIRLVAKGGDLIGALQVNERQRERLGV